MIQHGLFEVLTNNAPVAPLLADGKAVHFGLLAKNAATPAIVISRVSSQAEVMLDGTAGVIQARYQFDCLAPDYDDAAELDMAVRQLLQDFSGNLPDGTQVQAIIINVAGLDLPYEAGGKAYLFRRMSDFTIIFNETPFIPVGTGWVWQAYTGDAQPLSGQQVGIEARSPDTGMTLTLQGEEGELCYIVNSGAGVVTLQDLDGGSIGVNDSYDLVHFGQTVLLCFTGGQWWPLMSAG